MRLGHVRHEHHRPVLVVPGAGAVGRVDNEVVVAGHAGALADTLRPGALHLVEGEPGATLLHRPLAEALDERVVDVSYRSPRAEVGPRGSRRDDGASRGGGDGEDEEAARRHDDRLGR